MTARILDGKATLAAIKAELTDRVAVLAARGVVPASGPSSSATTRAPRGTSARSTRTARDRRHQHPPRPARDGHPGRGRGGHRRAERRPGLHRLPRAAAHRARRDGPAVTGRPGQGHRRPAPDQPRLAGPGKPGATAVHADGLIELLRRFDVPIAGAHVVIVGRGITVGRPLGLILTRKSENATVTICHTGTKDLAAQVREGDIVVAAAGVPGIITADMVKPVPRSSTSASHGSTASPPATWPPTWPRSPAGSPQPRRRRADDAGHAPDERRVGRRAAGRPGVTP